MQVTENIMQTAKNNIALSIKINTHRGYIGQSSCDNICVDMHNCLGMCYDALAVIDMRKHVKNSNNIKLHTGRKTFRR